MKEWRVWGGVGPGCSPPEPELASYDWQASISPGGPGLPVRCELGVQTILHYFSKDRGPQVHVGYVCDVTGNTF